MKKTICGIVALATAAATVSCIGTGNNVSEVGEYVAVSEATSCVSVITTKETTSNTIINTTVSTSNTTSETATVISDLTEKESSVEVIGESITESEQHTEPIVVASDIDVVPESTAVIEPVVTSRVVYKSSTHYFHNSDCHWYDNTCEDIDWSNIGSYEGRICSECNPEISGFQPYIDNTPSYSVDCSEYEIQLLAMLIHEESSGSWIGDNMVASTLINRCHNWGGGISENIYKSGQFTTAYSLWTYDSDEYEIARSNVMNGAYDSNVMWFESAGNGLNNFYSGNTYNERCYYGSY